MKLKLVGAKEKLLNALKGGVAKRDEPFEVTDEEGNSLLSQNTATQILFEEVKTKSSKIEEEKQ
ncbi:hypothetical protein LCGC14_0452530 [marine sediment metagenome]|uniref:Uncharacterized protein n=1 Tax=marine sediment metagenome TaxID=412755 RepID=A0A0F9T0U8_9ZZZZ